MLREIFDRIGPAGSTLRKAAGVAISLFIMAAFTAGATWSYMSDSENSTGNSITAGTLDLVPLVNGTYSGDGGNYYVTPSGNGINGHVEFGLVSPGESGRIGWILTNNGSIGGTLTLSSVFTFLENIVTTPESAIPANNSGGNGDMDQYLLVTLQRGIGSDQTDAEASMSYILGSSGGYVAISGLEAVLDAESVTLAAGGGDDTVVYLLNWRLPDAAEEPDIAIVESDSAQIDITFTFIQ
jgi:predicted ribosomally synthesized peptide with SipW-like signal peptide